MNNELQPHQSLALNAVINAVNNGQKKVLFAMPQGTGRLWTIASVLSNLRQLRFFQHPPRFLFLCDRAEIAKQAIERFNKSFNDPNIAGESESATIEVHTIQQILRSHSFDSKLFSRSIEVIVLYGSEGAGISEAASPIVRFLDKFASSIIIGIDSFIDKSIIYFGQPVFTYSLHEAVSDGLLAPVKFITTTLLRSNDRNTTPSALASRILKLVTDEKTVVYCPTQQYAVDLSRELNDKRGASIAHSVISNNKDNHLAIESFQNADEVSILTTVDLLGNMQLPMVECLVLARTISSGRYLLQVLSNYMGRSEGKDELKVIDFGGSYNLLADVFKKELPITIYDHDEVAATNFIRTATRPQAFSKTNIRLRDRQAIDGVMGVKELAAELADIVLSIPFEQGRMIGIFGKWGRGKTFLMNETWKILDMRKDIVRVDFHAWKYQDTPAIWAYLFEQFATKYYESSNTFMHRIWRRISLNTKRIGTGQFLWLFVPALLTIISSYFIPFSEKWELMARLGSALGVTGICSLVYIYFRYGRSAKDIFNKYYSKVSFVNLLGVQAEVQKELGHLFCAWTKNGANNKILLFVDDIDRCTEDKIIQIIDALRVMLEDDKIAKSLIVVTAIDERILKRAISAKYGDLLMSVGRVHLDNLKELHDVTSEYMDKLFIAGLKLGGLSYTERDEYLIELTKHDRTEMALDTIPSDTVDLRNANDNASKDEGSNSVKKYSLPNGGDNLKKQAGISGSSAHKDGNQRPDSHSRYLTKEELTLLRTGLREFGNATPRQIRIFYYRYLIAKNLLIARYTFLHRENPWILPDYAKSLVSLIIIYSRPENHLLVASDKLKALECSDSLMEVNMLENVRIDVLDYRIVLSVLEIVIAY